MKLQNSVGRIWSRLEFYRLQLRLQLQFLVLSCKTFSLPSRHFNVNLTMGKMSFEQFEEMKLRELEKYCEANSLDFEQVRPLTILKENLDLSTSQLYLNDPLKAGVELEAFAENLVTGLMENFVIVKGDSIYEIADAEFYFFSPFHQDITVYDRELEAGRFFFHNSGFDISFKSHINWIDKTRKKIIDRENSVFGGILISTLIKKDRKGVDRVIKGSKLCMWELWDSFNALEHVSSEYPVLFYKPLGDLKIEAIPRHFPIRDKESKLKSLNIKFNGIEYSWDDLKYFLDLKYRFRRLDLNLIAR